MKTSSQVASLMIGLMLAAASWAQEGTQDQEPPPEQTNQEQEQEQAQQEQVEQTDPAQEPELPEAPEDQPAETAPPPEEAIEAVSEQAGDTAPPPEPTETDSVDPQEESSAPEQEDAAQQPESADAGAEAAAQEPAEPSPDADKGGAEIFVVQAHPAFPPETAENIYRPLVDYLNESLPYRFDLTLAPDFHRYWLSTRRGENPHIVLEEPHLVAYRMREYDFTPLVRAEAPITYSLLTAADDADGAEASVQDFIGRQIATMPAPSLGYLVLVNWFKNPMRQPVIQSGASSWPDAIERAASGAAAAAIAPGSLVPDQDEMTSILTSQEFPGLTVAASPQVAEDIQLEIRDALLSLHEDEGQPTALDELDIQRFVEAQAEQYDGLEEWLDLVYSIL